MCGKNIKIWGGLIVRGELLSVSDNKFLKNVFLIFNFAGCKFHFIKLLRLYLTLGYHFNKLFL